MNPAIDLYDPNPPAWRRALAGLYGGLSGFRCFLFKTGIARPRRLPVRVIGVGNLTVGGAGKTPMVMMIVRELLARGVRTAVVSRGYRGRSRDAVNVVSDGRETRLGPAQAGDEPYLLAHALPEAVVIAGRNRWRAGLAAVDGYGAEAVVLDDGYQHLGLARDVNLLLLDARRPWGNGYLLPAGPLREPSGQAERATAFVLTRAPDGPLPVEEELKSRFPGRPVFRARHAPVSLTGLDGGESRPPGYLEGRRVIAFCGLARPETFLETLSDLGVAETVLIKWPDHYRPRDRDLRLIEAKAEELGLTEAVTTAKDAVKIAGRPFGRTAGRTLNVFVLDVEMEIVGRPDEFVRMVVGE